MVHKITTTTDQELKNYLDAHQGPASRIKTIFDYHYMVIQRELEQAIPKRDRDWVMDHLVEYMEETLNFPYGENLDEFIKSLTEHHQLIEIHNN